MPMCGWARQGLTGASRRADSGAFSEHASAEFSPVGEPLTVLQMGDRIHDAVKSGWHSETRSLRLRRFLPRLDRNSSGSGGAAPSSLTLAALEANDKAERQQG